jgi:hypothetical protein
LLGFAFLVLPSFAVGAQETPQIRAKQKVVINAVGDAHFAVDVKMPVRGRSGGHENRTEVVVYLTVLVFRIVSARRVTSLACTKDAENEHAGTVEALAAAVARLSPENRARLAAMLFTQPQTPEK